MGNELPTGPVLVVHIEEPEGRAACCGLPWRREDMIASALPGATLWTCPACFALGRRLREARRPVFSTLVIQDGPIREVGVNGDQIDDILFYVIERLREFNAPPHNNRQTSLAITHCEEALHWLADRSRERAARNIEGTDQP